MKKFFVFLIAAVIIVTGGIIIVKKTDLLSAVPEEVEVYNGNAYFYKKLSASSKKAYDLIMKDIFDFPEKIAVPVLTDADFDTVFEALLYDNTDLFFLEENCEYGTEKLKAYFVPKYKLSKEEYRKKLDELNNAEEEAVKNAIKFENDYEKEMYIHDYVISHCVYANKTGGDYSSAYGCIVNGKASCEGYSKSMKRLFDKCGLENFVAIGKTQNNEGKEEGHIWNIVKVNGKYYHIDATWDDNDNEHKSIYTYFNVDDIELTRTHKIDERFTGICNSLDENYFVKNGLYFSSYDEKTGNAISQKLAEYADNDAEQMPIKFGSDELYKKALEELFNEEEIYRLLVRANMLSKKELVTDKVNYLYDDTHRIVRIVNFIK